MRVSLGYRHVTFLSLGAMQYNGCGRTPTHLLGGLARGPRTCLDFLLGGSAILVPATLTSLRRARELIDQYASLPTPSLPGRSRLTLR